MTSIRPNPEPTELPRLASALRELYGDPASVPDEVDRAVRARIADHFSRRAATRRRRFALWPLAAAAVVAVASGIVWWRLAYAPAHSGQRIAADLNGDGRLDILDALSLARRIESGDTALGELDVNGDGVVDLRDADEIARTAVALDRTGTEGVG